MSGVTAYTLRPTRWLTRPAHTNKTKNILIKQKQNVPEKIEMSSMLSIVKIGEISASLGELDLHEISNIRNVIVIQYLDLIH